MNSLKGNRAIIQRFFTSEPVVYNSGRKDITASLTLQNRTRLEHSSGFDYAVWADLEVNRRPTIQPPSGRYSHVKWAVGYLLISGGSPLEFGGLFEKLQEPAETITSMLSSGINRANVHIIRRCIYDLQDQVLRDFDYPEFPAQFKKMPSG